jgi:hypothetical protein
MGAEALSIDVEDESPTLELTASEIEPRYLYADSEPFPHDFDFISALQGFVDLAVAVLAGGRESRRLNAELAEVRGVLAQRAGALDALLQNVARAAEGTAATLGASEPFMATTVQRLERACEELCAGTRSELERSYESQRARIDGSTAAIQKHMVDAVRTFLLGRELEVLSQDFRVELHEEGYEARLTQRLAGEISVAYDVDAELTAWDAPKRVADFMDSLTLEVGPRRSWLTRSVSLETRALDEYVIGSVRLEGDVADIGLRKKKGEPDTLSIHLAMINDRVQAQIVRAEDPSSVFDASHEDAVKLRELWARLLGTARVELGARTAVRSVRIDGEEALDAAGAERLVARLMDVLRPIVAEVGKRSHSSRELSLKRTLEDGRREERYLDRDLLTKRLEGLVSEDRARVMALCLAPNARDSRPLFPMPHGPNTHISAVPPPVPQLADNDH